MISPRLLISTSLKHVQKHGWTKDALAAGAVELGLPPAAHGLVERGPAALVEEHHRTANEDLREALDKFISEGQGRSKEEIVEFALWIRLQRTLPVQSTWAQAMAIGARPENTANTVQLLGEIGDIISSKFNERGEAYEWYANRVAIAAAYSACELYMLSDYSDNFQNTRRFIRNRVVNDGSRLMQAFYGLGDVANSLAGGVGMGATVGIKMGLDAAKSFIPGVGALLGNPLLDYMQKQAQGFVPGGAEKSSRADAERRNGSAFDDDQSLVDAKLPEGVSLFGLVSKDVKEATEIIRSNNPDFNVVQWPMWESVPTEPRHPDPKRVVRLVHDKQNIVVDVLRM